MKKVLDIAKYFLSTQDEDAGDTISNLKLQKLVYYAQGFNLALYGKRLFKESILAWEHGPVVAELYHEYKDYGADPIPMPNDLDLSIFSGKEKELLDDIHEVYGQYSAWKLRNMTHNEQPWIEARESDKNIITRRKLKKFFTDLLIDEED